MNDFIDSLLKESDESSGSGDPGRNGGNDGHGTGSLRGTTKTFSQATHDIHDLPRPGNPSLFHGLSDEWILIVEKPVGTDEFLIDCSHRLEAAW